MMHPSKLIYSRLSSIVLIFCCCFAIIIFRLFYLQIQTSTFFFQLSQRNFLRKEKIASPRGNIFDINRRLLATNRPTISIFWQSTGNKQLNQGQQSLVEYLNRLLKKECLQEITQAERSHKQIMLKQDISFVDLTLLLEQFPHHPNLLLQSTFKRFYPHETMACHLLGYISMANTEITGKMGLEKLMQDTLKGIPGEKLNIINSRGKKLEEHLIYQACAGKDVITTLNLDMQLLAETLFPKDHAGAFLIVDPKTGAIQAMVSRPHFDPNMFLSALTQNMWSALQENNPFINRCFEACYPPASLFKLVTVTAALEEEMVAVDTCWYCKGHVEFCGRAYHCNNHLGHGLLDLQSALAHSCNTPFYEIGKKIKIDTLAHYAHIFGLGESTGILLPEKTGLIPTSQWKRRTRKEPWWPGETLSATIGQTYLLTTPAQALKMVGGIVEGTLVKLRIFQDEAIEKTPLAISQQTRNFLKESLREVINKGTGKKLKRLPDITIYGKTGTAQTSDLSKRDLGSAYLEHAWLVVHAQYKQYSPIAFIIVIEHAGSTAYVKHVAYEFLKAYCDQLDQQVNS